MGTPNEGINGTLATGLLAHWDFDNGSLTDRSGNDAILTQVGTPNSVSDKDGNVGCAFSGLNTTNYFSTPNTLGINSFSISTWFTYTANYKGIFQLANTPSTGQATVLVFIDSDGFLKFFNGSLVYSTTYSPEKGTFVHLVITRNESYFKVFCNKKLYLAVSSNWGYSDRTKAYFGASIYDTGTSSIDETRLYSRALLDGDIITLDQFATGEVEELYNIGVNYTDPTPVVFNPVHPYRGAKSWNTSLNTCLTTIATQLNLTLTLPSANEVNWDIKILTALTVVESRLGIQLDKPQRDDKSYDIKLNRCIEKIISTINEVL